jgi:hypothetical protein
MGDGIRAFLLFSALAAASVPAPAAEPLGRLFYTPDQRAQLDTARSKKTRVNLTTESETPAEKAPPPPAPEVVTYGGIVRRSDGKATIWLNDRAVQDKDVRAGSTIVGRVRPDGSVTVQSAQSGRSVDLRVGQRAEMLSGKVEEGYAGRPKQDAAQETKPAGKPGADASAADAKAAERKREERDREDRVESAVKAMEDAAAKAAAPPPIQVPLQLAPPVPR